MIDSVQLANDLGLKYDGHDSQGHWFSFRGEEKRFINLDYDEAALQAAEWVLTKFYGYQK